MNLYRIFNSKDKEVAVISESKPYIFQIKSISNNQSEIPVLLQDDCSTGRIAFFLKSRVKPDSVYIEEHRNDDKGLINLLKKNNGRIKTDDFYIIVEENVIQ